MRLLGRIVLLVVVLAVVAGATMYWRPLWVADQQVRYAMWRGGAHRHSVDLPEGRIKYFEQGDGAPLVIIHGLGGRKEDFAALMPKFAAQGFHVYALDLLGYGESDKPASSDYSITTEEQIVTEFMDAVGVPRADIVGWSMGGWIALKLALDSPQRVDRIAVYDSAGIAYQTTADTALFAPTDSAGLTRLVRALSPTMAVPPAFAQPDIFRKLARSRWVIDRSMTAMRSGHDILDFRLAGMQRPLLIVYGAEDVLTPPSVGETMHKLDPRSMYATVDGCGHFAPVECSKPVAKVTGEFFKAQPAMVGGEVKLAR
jgi:pimeloyl-ACP methyl ester carboxylesterase